MTQSINPTHNKIHISTHTSLAGRDESNWMNPIGLCVFLLTRPSRDVTNGIEGVLYFIDISTHTSLAGRDQGLSYFVSF